MRKIASSRGKRKHVTVTLDQADVMALDSAAYCLRLSRSEVVRRLSATAHAAVLWGAHGYVGKDREELRKLAASGCMEWGLFTLGGPLAERLAAPPPLLRVIQGGGAA